ncbi:MAG: CPBP family intramembrane glutamic endopeptidase, partial [Spirochaetota bacterium]
VVVLCDLRRPGSSLRFGWRPPNTSDALTAGVGLAATWVTVAAVSLIAGSVFAEGGGPEPTVAWSFERRELIPVALVSTLAIGYREEIFYRAYIADRAEEAQIDARAALAGGALLFATGHIYQGVMGFVLSLAIGLVLATVYYRTRSLHGIAVAHGLYNFAVLLLSGSA